MNLQKIASYITRGRLIATAAVVLVLFFAYAGMSWYVVAEAREAEVKAIDRFPDDLGLSYEEVTFNPRGDDSITLRGWWIAADNPVGTVIRVHGLDQNRADQLEMLKEVVDGDLSVLAFDLRGHGESDDVPLGAGYYETDDVRGAIDYALNERGVEPGKLLLMGRSFGAAVALMVGYAEPAVAGVYADSSFATLSDVLTGEVERRTPFPKWLAQLLKPGITVAGSMNGIDVDAVRPLDAIGQYEYPLGLTHCLDDDRIPLDHSHRLRQQVRGPVFYTLFPRCGHAGAYDSFSDQYSSIVRTYFWYSLGVLDEYDSAA